MVEKEYISHLIKRIHIKLKNYFIRPNEVSRLFHNQSCAIGFIEDQLKKAFNEFQWIWVNRKLNNIANTGFKINCLRSSLLTKNPSDFYSVSFFY